MTTTTTTKTKTTNGDYYEKFHLTSKIVARKRPRKSAMRPEYEFFNGKLNQNINNHQFGHMFISINFWTCLCAVSVCVCVHTYAHTNIKMLLPKHRLQITKYKKSFIKSHSIFKPSDLALNPIKINSTLDSRGNIEIGMPKSMH